MKRIFSVFLLLAFSNGFAQNIGISADGATPHASAMLDVSSTTKGVLVPRMKSTERTGISSPAAGLLVYDTDTKTFWFFDGTVWNQLSTGSVTNYWSQNAADIYSNVPGNVGIGTSTPLNRLSIQTANNSYGVVHSDGNVSVGTYIGLNKGWLGTKSNHPLAFFTNNGLEQMTLLTNGNVGIGTTSPTSKLTLQTPNNADGFTHISDGGIVLKDVVGGISAGFGTYSPHTFRLVANSVASINIEPNGNVGIGASVIAANKLQIGSMGTSGFNGNDFAIGNGTNALGVFQSNTTTQFASSTNIVLLPGINNGSGRVGINTTTPRAPLDVADNVTVPTPNASKGYAYYTLGNNFGAVDVEGGVDAATVPNVSIVASNRVLASEFDAFSDARIKNVVGISNSATDLETLNALTITDYTMKDRVKYGNRPFKKVIAQEVEKVYPQVISKHTDFVPNVYQTAIVEKTAKGYRLHFTREHNIGATAKKLRLLVKGTTTMQDFDIVSIPSANDVVINAGDLHGESVFVYGEEVADFRTVDYEGLTTLNISATQELSSLVKQQQAMIERLEKRVQSLEGKTKDTRLAHN